MSEVMATDPFSSKDILKLPTIRDDQIEAWHGFKLDGTLQSQSLFLANVQDIGLPSLKPLAFHLSSENASIEQIDADEDSKSERISDELVTSSVSAGESPDDIWNHDEVCSPSAGVLVAGWDQWAESGKSMHNIELFSEAKAPVHDLVNSKIWHKSVGEPLKFVEVKAFQQGLVNLILGHSSAIFEWNDAESCFQQRIHDFALTGFNQGIIKNICDLFIKCGTTFRRMSLLNRSEFHQIPTLHALRGSISNILDILERYYISKKPHTLTIIQLTHVAQNYLELLSLLERVQVSASKLSNELEILTTTISAIDENWISKPHLRTLLTELCARLLQPAIDGSFQHIDSSNLTREDSEDHMWLLAGLLSNYQSKYDETMSNVSAMQTYLLIPKFTFDNIPQFQLIRHWAETQDIIRTADEWEIRLLRSLTKETPIDDGVLENRLSDKQTISCNPFRIDLIDFSCEHMKSRFRELDVEEPFAEAVIASIQKQQSLESLYTLSPLQALEHTVVPALCVQHRISSYILMRTLFLEHDLVIHLSHLHAYQLLGDGPFAVRLSRVLFNSDQESAEDLRKPGLSTGLRLEDREVWPPASSELRLVLMSLMSEPMAGGLSNEPSKNISFAIKELPEDRLELCRNVHSIHALDFLRLVYTATDPILELVITPSSLERYDRIFGFLLILLRIHSLTQSLLTQSLLTATTCIRTAERPLPTYLRLCLELHHVATTFMDYALNVAIGIPQKQFFEKANTIHRLLFNGDYQDSIQAAGSIAGFRQSHEEMLDHCMKSLLLKTQQHEAYDAICNIFSLILELASADYIRMNTSVVMKQRQKYLDLVRSFVSQIKSISTSTQDPALKRLQYLLLQIDSDYFGD